MGEAGFSRGLWFKGAFGKGLSLGGEGGDDGGGLPGAGVGVEGGVPEPGGGGNPAAGAVADLLADVEAALLVVGEVGEPVLAVDGAVGDMVTGLAQVALGGLETAGASGGVADEEDAASGLEDDGGAGVAPDEVLLVGEGACHAERGSLEVGGPV